MRRVRAARETIPPRGCIRRALDLKEMRRAGNRFVRQAQLLGHRAPDQRRRHHFVEIGIAADEFHRHRAMRHLRPQVGLRSAGKNVRLVFARTRENPVAGRAIVPQRRARHQLVCVGHPSFEAPAELLREIHRIVVALGTPRRARGERLLVGLLQVLDRMSLARIDRRIEQHQRVETRAVLERMHRSRDARQRMEQSGGRLRAELAINRMPDDFHVLDEIFPRMSFERHAAGYARDCGSRRRSLRSARAMAPRMESSRRSRGRCRDSARAAARPGCRVGGRGSSRRHASSRRKRDARAARDEVG